jgi:cation:H+ antiporter
MSWVLFLVSAAVIVVAGTKLARYADQIAEFSGLGRLWIGVVLVAGASLLFRIAKMFFQQPARISRSDTLL